MLGTSTFDAEGAAGGIDERFDGIVADVIAAIGAAARVEAAAAAAALFFSQEQLPHMLVGIPLLNHAIGEGRHLVGERGVDIVNYVQTRKRNKVVTGKLHGCNFVPRTMRIWIGKGCSFPPTKTYRHF